MKILHIIPNLRKGGAERLVIDIVRELSKKEELNVKLVLFENRIEYDVQDIKQFIHIIPSKIKFSLLKKNEYTIQYLQGFINKFNPSVIHTHLFTSEIISRSCHYQNTKWFSHCHGNMGQFRNFDLQTLINKKHLTNYYEKKYLFNSYDKNGGTHFIAISNDTKKYLEQTASTYKISLLLNAINYTRFYQNLTSKNNNEKLKMINIGSFQDKKNQVFLIEVACILRLKNVLFELHFLGEGKNRHSLEQKIKEYQLGNYIYLHGNVEKVEELLWQSDIYIHSASYEPFGLVLIEAMAAGLPVITLDGKGNRDILENGKNGYMLFEEKPEIFANTIINLWNDKNKYQEISVYAQQYAKQFDIHDYCKKLLIMYNQN